MNISDTVLEAHYVSGEKEIIIWQINFFSDVPGIKVCSA